MQAQGTALSSPWKQTQVIFKGYGIIPTAIGIVVVGGVLRVLPHTALLPEARTVVDYSGRTALFGSLALALLSLNMAYEPAGQIAEAAARPWAVYRACRLALTTAFCIGTISVASPADAPYAGVVVFTLVGEGLLFARIAGSSLAWLLPLGHVLLSAVVGTDAFGNPFTWAWILERKLSFGGWLAALLLFISGLSLWSMSTASFDESAG